MPREDTQPTWDWYKEHGSDRTDVSPMSASPAADRVRKEIDRLGLHGSIIDLEMSGVTVIPREATGITEEFLHRLRTAMLRVMGKRNGVDLLSGDYRTLNVDPDLQLIGNHWHVLYEDDVFAEAAMHPMVLALARYLLGESCTLGLNAAFVKPGNCAGSIVIPLHYDSPEPLGGGRTATGANIAILGSDYLEDADGPTVFVPGSHRFSRAPAEWEMDPESSPYPIMKLRATAGSIVAWHGATWHGSIPRTKDGLRMHLTNIFYRRNMRAPHLWDEPEAVALCERIPGLDQVLGLGEYAHCFPTKEEIRDGTYEYLTEMGRDVYA